MGNGTNFALKPLMMYYDIRYKSMVLFSIFRRNNGKAGKLQKWFHSASRYRYSSCFLKYLLSCFDLLGSFSNGSHLNRLNKTIRTSNIVLHLLKYHNTPKDRSNIQMCY